MICYRARKVAPNVVFPYGHGGKERMGAIALGELGGLSTKVLILFSFTLDLVFCATKNSGESENYGVAEQVSSIWYQVEAF